MRTSPVTSEQGAESSALKNAWLHDIEALAEQVRGWVSERPDWQVEMSETEITEEAIGGEYQAPVVQIASPQGRLVLEPIALFVFGAKGRVDLYAWPTLFRVMLLRKLENGQPVWTVRTDSGIDWPQPWQKETFFDLAQRLLGA